MKLTKPLLQKINLFNAHDYSKGNPYIDYRPQQTGRWYQSAGWAITWPGHTFKDTPWQDYGNLVIDVYFIDEREQKLLMAQEKFKDIFGVEELAKTPFGTWMEKSFVQERNKELIALLKDQGSK